MLANEEAVEEATVTTFEAYPKQEEFLDAVFDGRYLYIAFGGGIRGTKTWGTLSAIFLLCRIYPGSRWAIVRKDLPTLRRNTIPSFNKLRATTNGFVGEVNQGTWTSTCQNGSEIIFFPESLQQDPDYDRWRGLEVNGFLLEEADELAEASANMAIQRAGAWIIPATVDNPSPQQPPPYIFFTFNPNDKWPRYWFFEKWVANRLNPPYKFIPTTAADNPSIPQPVRDAWKNLPERDYKRFVLGDWSVSEDPDQLIKFEWVQQARNVLPTGGIVRVGADIARFGSDNSTFAKDRGNSLRYMATYKKRNLVYVADELQTLLLNPRDPVDPDNCNVDSVGLGAGVVDILHSRNLMVREFIAGAKPIPREDSVVTFRDLRSQAWWEYAEALRFGLRSLPVNCPEQLVADLTAPKYKITSERMVVVESKDDIRKRISRSTDYGDAEIMAAFELPPPPRTPVIQDSISIRSYGT